MKSLTRENLYLIFDEYYGKGKERILHSVYIYYFPKKHLPEEINYFCLGFL